MEITRTGRVALMVALSHRCAVYAVALFALASQPVMGQDDGPWGPVTDPTEKARFLDLHNRARGDYCGLEAVTWDPQLAESAYKVATSCQFQHSERTQRDAWCGDSCGENLATYANDDRPGNLNNIPTGMDAVELAMTGYLDEKPDWNCASNTGSGGVTSHYTQIVCNNVERIGCALAFCGSSPSWAPFANQWIMSVCHYAGQGDGQCLYAHPTDGKCAGCGGLSEGSTLAGAPKDPRPAGNRRTLSPTPAPTAPPQIPKEQPTCPSPGQPCAQREDCRVPGCLGAVSYGCNGGCCSITGKICKPDSGSKGCCNEEDVCELPEGEATGRNIHRCVKPTNSACDPPNRGRVLRRCRKGDTCQYVPEAGEYLCRP